MAQRNVFKKWKPLYTFIANRTLHTSSVLSMFDRKNIRAGVPKISVKKEKKLTYQEAQPPDMIGVRKAWDSWNSSQLKDIFIRKFVYGTFQGKAKNIIIKRRYNVIYVAGLVNLVSNSKLSFLVAYTEEILSYFLKCPVKLEIQAILLTREDYFKKI
ncbi:hypothetical protein KUTeg_003790 [Tegillarca granosa]|uniref:28S ribosomal protein S24, mitochondrial n=1 Tax=Tegillarca granosa TaxID=220873 RepID=A0ABQ9FN40_TEGGR|nr:hypothetical protein KUTeg_003790 [Tegillarca granosa]